MMLNGTVIPLIGLTSIGVVNPSQMKGLDNFALKL
jgi:hypothetical protein